MKIITLNGPSCAGKSTIIKNIYKEKWSPNIAVLEVDSFYLPSKPPNFNFDQVSAFDIGLLQQTIEEILRVSESKAPIVIKLPQYSYKSKKRSWIMTEFNSQIKALMIVGCFPILLIGDKWQNSSINIYIDIDRSLLIKRRLIRDTKERFRTEDEIQNQLDNSVLDSTEHLVEPLKAKCHVVLDGRKSKEAVYEDLKHRVINNIIC